MDCSPSVAWRSGGLEEALRRFDDLSTDNLDNRYDHNSSTLNQLGYDLLGEEQVEEAKAVFERGVAEYPASANLLDSLAEANLRVGRREAALACVGRQGAGIPSAQEEH
jgi:tetratricopeptide (TPR) repeat protein